VPDLYQHDEQHTILDLIDDSVLPHAHAVKVSGARKLLAATRAGI
jgi:hypothetical protein